MYSHFDGILYLLLLWIEHALFAHMKPKVSYYFNSSLVATTTISFYCHLRVNMSCLDLAKLSIRTLPMLLLKEYGYPIFFKSFNVHFLLLLLFYVIMWVQFIILFVIYPCTKPMHQMYQICWNWFTLCWKKVVIEQVRVLHLPSAP